MPQQKQSVKEIFDEAAEFGSAEERNAWLDDVCADDPELRAQVEDLLQAHEDAGSFLEPVAAPTVTPAAITEQAGDTIGPYKLLQQIGEGGMGVVYMAEQDQPVQRRVALKIIKPGMDTRQVIARFEAERQALAMMDHPNIAKVLDAGTTDTGRPYFVMELVKGLPITRYCDKKHLTPRERLELFLPVCQAVQHAHQKGVIHRDLKPSNILVARYDDRAVPKIIDFGVAKAMSQRLTEKTMFTQYGQIVGTIDYMSPEQAEFNQLDVDTRSDIYSLGVLLYELLTGETPFDRERLRSAAFDELLRIIREEEPPRPSTRLSSSETLPSVAADRHIEPHKLSTLLRGELDWIVMKALEKDRGRRYETASAFATDVQHYLVDEAVAACPPSAAYRLKKFARRNRVMLTTTLVILFAAGTALSLAVLAHRRGLREEQERIARIEAERRQEIAERERIAAEEAQLQAELDALYEEGRRLIFEVEPDYQTAIENFTTVLAHRPADAEVLLLRGSAHQHSGRSDQAIDDLTRVLELQGEANPAAHALLARAYQATNNDDEAVRHLALAQQDAPDNIEALVTQAIAMRYDARALDLINQAIDQRPLDVDLTFYRARVASDLATTLGNPEYVDIAVTDFETVARMRPDDWRPRKNLCYHLMWPNTRLSVMPAAAAHARAREVLDEWLESHPDDVRALRWLLPLTKETGGTPEERIEIGLRIERQDPHHYVHCGQMAEAYIELGEYAEALKRLNFYIQNRRRALYIARRAQLHLRMGNLDAARADLAEARQTDPKRRSAVDWRSICHTYDWGFGDYDEMLEVANEWIAMAPENAMALGYLATAHVNLGQWEEAADAFREAVTILPGEYRRHYNLALAHLAADDPAGHGEAAREMLIAFTETDNPQAAVFTAWTCSLVPEAVDDYEPVIALARRAVDEDPDSVECLKAIGAALLRAERIDEAIEELTRADELIGDASELSSSPAYVWYLLATAHARAGNADTAREFFDKAADWSAEHGEEDARTGWFRKLTIRLLHQEAEAALEGFGVDMESGEDDGDAT